MYNTHDGTAEGEHLRPLCISLRARSRTCSARVLSLLPLGTEQENLLNRLTDELILGAKECKGVNTPDGITRRVFLDLVGVGGDTPATNTLFNRFLHTINSRCYRFCIHFSEKNRH